MKNFDKTEEKMNENLNEESQTAVSTDNDKPEEDQNETDRKKWYKKPRKIFIVGGIVLLLLGVLSFIIWKNMGRSHHKAEPIPEYVEEPNSSSISYESSKINIVNPSTKKIIVEDVEWYHGGDDYKDSIVLFAKNGKRGFCNIITNQVIVEPLKYTKAWQFSEGLAAVEKNGFIGFVNTSGKVVIGFRFPFRGNPLYEFVFHNGHCVVADSNNKIGIINNKGQWIVKPLYDDIDLTKEYAIVYKEGDFKKQVDYNGNILKDGIIDDINDIYYATSYTDAETGRPMKGEIRNPDFYEYRVGNHSGLINSQGKFITRPIYTSITGISKTLFCATLQDYRSKVFIDQNGTVISGKSFYKM